MLRCKLSYHFASRLPFTVEKDPPSLLHRITSLYYIVIMIITHAVYFQTGSDDAKESLTEFVGQLLMHELELTAAVGVAVASQS